MQPETPTPDIHPGQTPQNSEPNLEHIVPEQGQSLDSGGIEAGLDRVEQQAEARAIAGDVASTTLTPTTVPTDDNVAKDTTDDDSSNTPLVANDDDLIEKEWVDKAKEIVAATKDDPYTREEAASKLQVEYLKKRYGKELKAVQ